MKIAAAALCQLLALAHFKCQSSILDCCASIFNLIFIINQPARRFYYPGPAGQLGGFAASLAKYQTLDGLYMFQFQLPRCSTMLPQPLADRIVKLRFWHYFDLTQNQFVR